MKIGVLDIQGSVEEHENVLSKFAKIQTVLVKTKDDLQDLSGLIIPGGESTTIGKLLERFGLDIEIKKRVEGGMAVWGTCAGAILLAQFGLIDVEIERNAYGRQIDSFETELDFNNTKIPGIFIRAPKIVGLGQGVETLVRYKDDVVGARQNNVMITTFHPELAEDLTVQRYFVEMCK